MLEGLNIRQDPKAGDGECLEFFQGDIEDGGFVVAISVSRCLTIYLTVWRPGTWGTYKFSL